MHCNCNMIDDIQHVYYRIAYHITAVDIYEKT